MMLPDEIYARDRLTILADQFNVSVEDLVGPSRVAKLSKLRRWYIRNMRIAGVKSPVIAKVLKRDCSTIRCLWL
jgi:hypothetical protein